MTVRDLQTGQTARIVEVGGEGALRQHFLDMGMIPGVEVTLVRLAPMGDPMELRIRGYELTLRLADAEKIKAEPVEGASEERVPVRTDKHSIAHPGLGEDGIFHEKGSGNPLPEGEVLTFALVGNQNSGKTTLFNQLTGSSQHVGNFPGVTVDRKDGSIRGKDNTLITDLPGIYSMSPYSSEELVSRDFVLNEKPKAIINIVDATNIERNLYLTMQLLEMNVPMVVALNMMDELRGNGGSVDINQMENMLGVPVVPISAAKNEGIDELVEHALHIAYYQERPETDDFCDENDNNGAVHRCIHAVIHLIYDHAERAGIPVRFAAGKAIENDEQIIQRLELDDNEIETLEHITKQMEKERGLDRSAALADMRFAFIEKVCRACITKPYESREHIRSQKIDKWLTGKYTAIPIFIGVMALVFFLTFNVIGAWQQDLLERGIEALAGITDRALTEANVNETLHRLIIKGVFEGVGSVLSFLPVIVTMFFFISILEDSGYIARVAFFMDKLMRRIGLSGRSIVPLLIGFGCTVPAVMSSRTLPSARDRKMTVLLTPFMSCTAKLPIYTFFVEAFFPEKGWIVITLLYFTGIILGVAAALIFKRFLFRGEAVPFVMELPNYRLPSARNVIQLLWEKAKDFLQRAFSVIFLASVIVWILQSFDLHLNLVTDQKDSILAMISSLLVPVFRPLGLGDWRICTSLISGFMAKESVVSVLGVLYGADGLSGSLSTLTVCSLLVFSLLYTPCVAAVTSIKSEMGGRWAAFVVLWQCLTAWLCAFAVYTAGSLAGM